MSDAIYSEESEMERRREIGRYLRRNNVGLDNQGFTTSAIYNQSQTSIAFPADIHLVFSSASIFCSGALGIDSSD